VALIMGLFAGKRVSEPLENCLLAIHNVARGKLDSSDSFTWRQVFEQLGIF
jgi:nitrogen fixation/metabolism regulation signal transduction histidine kinase